MALWTKIAKNELRTRTHKFRNHRKLFFVCLYSLLIFWAFVVIPWLFDFFMPEVAELAQVEQFIIPVIAMIIEYALMIFFIVILMYPLNNIYRKSEIGFKEVLLSSPVTAGDIFVGEFMGKLPLLSAAVLAFTPIVVGLLNPIVNLTLVQVVVIYMCVFGGVFLATLIGTILMCWIEHKIAQSEKARDLAKALLMLLAIGMVILIYSVQFGYQFIIENPELKNYLMWYPALWFSNIILYVFDPVLLDTYILNEWMSMALAVLIPILLLYFSYKKADKFYTLEGGVEKFNAVIKEEGAFYKIIRGIIGAKWKGLVITQFKEFLRKKENIMKLVYLTGLTCVYGLVFSFSVSQAQQTFISGAFKVLMVVFMGGMLYGLMLGSYIFVGSKDLLWVYKRSPRGIGSMVYSYIFSLLILNIMIAVGVTTFFTFLFEFDLVNVIVFFIAYLSYGMMVLIEAIGIQSFSPSFEEKGKNMGMNMFKLMSIQMGVFMGFMFLMIWISETFPNPIFGDFLPLILFLSIHLVISVPLFIFGIKSLKKIE